MPGALPFSRPDRRVPVYHLHVVARLGKPLLDLFGNQHRTVFASGATKRNGEVALALANVVRDQVHQQLRYAGYKLLGLREREDVTRSEEHTSELQSLR